MDDILQPTQPTLRQLITRLYKKIDAVDKPVQAIPERIKIGEIDIQSRVIKADRLLDLVLDTLEKKNVKEYLKTLDAKKISGTFPLGVN